MALTPCSDLSPADWITSSRLPWQQLVCFGPSGFAAYARLRFLPEPTYDGQSENDVENVEPDHSDNEQLRMLFEVLARHTQRPKDCYFCLWDGYGDIYGGAAGLRRDRQRGRKRATVPPVAPMFPPKVLNGPKVVVPGRAYFLFHGTLASRRLGCGGDVAGPAALGHARTRLRLARRPRLVYRQ